MKPKEVKKWNIIYSDLKNMLKLRPELITNIEFMDKLSRARHMVRSTKT